LYLQLLKKIFVNQGAIRAGSEFIPNSASSNSQFLAWLTENQRLFIAQEYIDGKTYSQILYERLSEKGRPFSETEVRAWLLDMLPVLEYIHEHNIIHRYFWRMSCFP